MTNIINLLVFLGLVLGSIFLQIKLSRSENRFLGWILPGLSLMFSLLIFLNLPTFESISTETFTTRETPTETVEELGQAEGVGQDQELVISSSQTGTGETISIIVFFLGANLPTLVFLGIYFGERRRMGRRKELEKMKIQDF